MNPESHSGVAVGKPQEEPHSVVVCTVMPWGYVQVTESPTWMVVSQTPN